MKASQRAQVLKHLQSGRTLTAYGALEKWGVLRLASRVLELRHEGHPITSRLVKRGQSWVSLYGMKHSGTVLAHDRQGAA